MLENISRNGVVAYSKADVLGENLNNAAATVAAQAFY